MFKYIWFFINLIFKIAILGSILLSLYYIDLYQQIKTELGNIKKEVKKIKKKMNNN